MSLFIAANLVLHLLNFTVFYVFLGPESFKWALLFSVIVQMIPSRTVFINRNSVYCSAVTLLMLHFGAEPVTAFVVGGVLAIVPFALIGIVPRMVSESNILPALFTILLWNFGVNPMHIYIFSSFVVAKIWIAIFANTKYMEWKALKKNYDIQKNLGQRERYRKSELRKVLPE
ncbi:MAG: hypothetical protein ABH829_00800 [archaeon]